MVRSGCRGSDRHRRPILRSEKLEPAPACSAPTERAAPRRLLSRELAFSWSSLPFGLTSVRSGEQQRGRTEIEIAPKAGADYMAISLIFVISYANVLLESKHITP